MGRRGKGWLTGDPEEREWYSLARKMGRPVADLQAAMTDAEFRRHCEDQQDYPDAADRSAHLLYILATLLNSFVGAWTKDGRPPFPLRHLAPWLKPDPSDQPQQLTLTMAEAMFAKVGDPRVKIPGR